MAKFKSPPCGPTAVDAFVDASRAPSTRRGYASDWRDFVGWCELHQEQALPAAPETVGRFLAERASTHKYGSLDRRLSAIVVMHRQNGLRLDRHTPEIAEVMAGIRRIIGVAPVQKEALSLAELHELLQALPNTTAGLRDKALLLLGFAGAFRRSELASLERRDLVFTSEGLAVILRRGKEDPDGKGEIRGIPFGRAEETCAVRAVRAWLLAARLGDGPVFRRFDRQGRLMDAGISGEAVAIILRRAIRLAGERAGRSRTEIRERQTALAGHSLRAGFITTAAEAGCGEWEIMQHTGHKRASTLRRYIRRGQLFAKGAASKVGL